MREGDFQKDNPIFAIDIIHNLKFLIDTGSQISIIRKDCVPLGALEKKEEKKREFIGITGEAVKFQTSIELQLKLVDFGNKMEMVHRKFLINGTSDTPNIMGLDILREAGIVINGRDGT